MKKVLLGLFTFIAVLSLAVVIAKADTNVSVKLTDGVQIRTDGNNGLRWEATVTEPQEGQVYGFVFAQGELVAADLTVNTADAVIQEVTELDENNKYRATMVNFPKAAATKDITVRAYVKDGETYIYSDNVVTRNLSEIAVVEYEKGNDGAFVKAVYDASETTFNLNGGTLAPEYEFTITKYNNGAWSNETMIVKSTSGFTTKNYYRIFVKYDDQLNLYKVVAVGDAGVSVSNIDHDYKIQTVGTPSDSEELKAGEIIKQIINSDNPTSYYLDFTAPTSHPCNTVVKVSSLYEVFNENSVHLGGGALLPDSHKDYYNFDGWYDNAAFTGEKITKQTEKRELFAKYSPIEYTIDYNLLGGSTTSELVTSYNIESQNIVLPTKETMNIECGEFDGWYDNPSFDGQEITEIKAGSNGNIKLYAKWIMEAPTEIELSDGDLNALEAVTPTLVVGSNFSAGHYLINDSIYTAGITAFKTINEALAVAKEEDKIYVFAGTYSNALTVTSNGLTIYGPNFNVHGNEQRFNEANITSLTTINAERVTINGLQFTKAGSIRVGGNNTTIDNVNMSISTTITGAASYKDGSGNTVWPRSNRSACIVDSADITNLTIQNSKIDVIKGKFNNYDNLAINLYNVTNLSIVNNYITNSSATTIDGSGSFACLRIYTISGTANLSNNKFYWATNGYVWHIGGLGNNCTEINVIDNLFDGNANIRHTATILIQSGTTKLKLNIIGNQFYYFTGGTYNLKNDKGSTVTIKYNYYDANTKFSFSTQASAKITYENNYYEGGINTNVSPSDKGVITSKETLDELYAAYKANLV